MKFSDFLSSGGFSSIFNNKGVNIYNLFMTVLIKYNSMDIHVLNIQLVPVFD